MQVTGCYVYRAFDLVIASDVPFSGIPASNAEPDVWIKLRSSIECSDMASLAANANAQSDVPNCQPFRGSLPGVARFYIREGTTILVDPEPGVDVDILQPVLLGPVMAIVMRQRGYLVLHGSCVAIDGGAIAFLGHSGWGKSTLAQAFHAQGYDLLSDDLCPILRSASGHMSAIPSIPVVKLWPDAVASLSHTDTLRAVPKQLPPLHRRSPKRVRELDGGFCQSALPLKCLYVLARGDRLCIEPLDKQAAFASLIQFSRALHGMRAPDMASAHLHQCAGVASHVPVRRLFRRPSLSDLPALVRRIQADVELATASLASRDIASRSVPKAGCVSSG